MTSPITLETDVRVLALVALGSMASDTYRDEWSDHDFWVITAPGTHEALLNDLSWLPNQPDIVTALRQATHYYTVLYRAGHIAEFAVFASHQLEQGKLNTYQLLFDKRDIGKQIDQLYQKTAQEQPAPDTAAEFGNFLVYVWVGLARYWRGEKLSSHKYLTQYALDTLLSLIVAHVPPQKEGVLDSLDTRRRFELAYPHLATELSIWSSATAPELAIRLLKVAERTLAEVLPDYSAKVVAELYKHVGSQST